MEELRPSRSRVDLRPEPVLGRSASETSSTGTQQGKSSRLRLLEQSLALTSKGAPNGQHKWSERDHARDRAGRVEHAWCECFYGPGKDYGRRAAKALRRSARL